jgi:hypothetical protein
MCRLQLQVTAFSNSLICVCALPPLFPLLIRPALYVHYPILRSNTEHGNVSNIAGRAVMFHQMQSMATASASGGSEAMSPGMLKSKPGFEQVRKCVHSEAIRAHSLKKKKYTRYIFFRLKHDL